MILSQSIVDANLSVERGQMQHSVWGTTERRKKNAVFILGSVGDFFHIFVLTKVLYPTSVLIVK